MSSEHYREIIVIGDVHGRFNWRQIVERHAGAHFIFLGDYCDPYKHVSKDDIIENLNNIISLKENNPEQFTLLLGNHDMHYLYPEFPRGSRYDWQIENELHNIFTTKRSLFNYAWQIKNILFTHAGVSQHWIDECFHTSLTSCAAETLNSRNISEYEKQALFACGMSRLGDEPFGGIFWADLREMDSLPKDIIQVVGHSRRDSIRKISDEKNNACLFDCDCLEHNIYMRITNEENEMCFYEMNIESKESNIIMRKKQQIQA